MPKQTYFLDSSLQLERIMLVSIGELDLLETLDQGILNQYQAQYQSSTSTVPYQAYEIIKNSFSFSWLYCLIRIGPNRIMHQYGTVPYQSNTKFFERSRVPKLFFMTKPYRLLASTVWYVPNRAVRVVPRTLLQILLFA